jgi:hypothetical protein
VALLELEVPAEGGDLAVPEVELVAVLLAALLEQSDSPLQLLSVTLLELESRLKLLYAVAKRLLVSVVRSAHLGHTVLLSSNALLFLSEAGDLLLQALRELLFLLLQVRILLL